MVGGATDPPACVSIRALVEQMASPETMRASFRLLRERDALAFSSASAIGACARMERKQRRGGKLRCAVASVRKQAREEGEMRVRERDRAKRESRRDSHTCTHGSARSTAHALTRTHIHTQTQAHLFVASCAYEADDKEEDSGH